MLFNMLNIFRKPNHAQVVLGQLEQAKHDLLESQAQEEYYRGISKVLEERISRLQIIARFDNDNKNVVINKNNLTNFPKAM